MPGHLYIHFPYCLYKCHYCDFNSHAWEAGKIPHQEYINALLAELNQRKNLFEAEGRHFYAPGTEIGTVFFGGGTPSLMRPADVDRILRELQKYFTFTADTEITIEANPGTVTQKKLNDFYSTGINRLSIGVQSLNDAYLARFGRIHTADESVQAIKSAIRSRITNISTDLMFGFPGQTLAEWQKDLQAVLEFHLNHLSCYALTAEPSTIYTRQLAQGDFSETGLDVFADMLETTYELTDARGVNAYEISNFARPGFECRHNLAYWKYESYLGLGAGACSNWLSSSQAPKLSSSEIRTTNLKSPQAYMNTVKQNSFFEIETIDPKTAMKEFMMMGLRLKVGVGANDFKKKFGVSLEDVFEPQLEEAVAFGLLKQEGNCYSPTCDGFCLNNKLVSLFI